MALETAQFIHQLEISNPAATDQLSQADDHIRLLKAVIKATFPNITGPVTLTQAQLNTVFSIPVGIISAWYGPSNAIPAGYALCDGSTVNLSDGSGTIQTPNLTNRVIVGAGSLIAQGQTGGAATSSVNTGEAGAHTHTVSGGAHTHTGAIGGTVLTLDQLPAHRHANGVVNNNDSVFNRGGLAASPTLNSDINENQNPGTREGYTESVGGGQAHGHSLTINENTHSHAVSTEGAHQHSVSVSTLQPAVGLHYIMKV